MPKGMQSKVSINPTVSVIIPTHNRADLLRRAIKSVLAQTFKDFEIIVVNDASKDNTEEVVKGFSYPWIRYIRHEINKGGSAARNTGIMEARGRYIAFLDDDDEWLPEKLEKQMEIFDSSYPEVSVVYTAFWRMEDVKKTYIPSLTVKKKEGKILNSLLNGNFVTTPTVIIKKDCFDKAGMFDENLPRLQDWDLFIRIAKYYEFRFIDEPLLSSYVQKDSISQDQDALIKALELILKKYLMDFEEAGSSALSRQYYLLGDALCSKGRLANGRSYLLKAFKAYPINIKSLIALFFSLFGKSIYNKFIEFKLSFR